jgi:cytoskeletal protein CcmA (bactofilin family)
MARVTKTVLFITLALIGVGISAQVLAQETGDNVVIRDVSNKDLYAAGSTVDIQAVVRGDVVAAGDRVTVSGAVTDDIIAAGRTVTISGPVGDDVRLAGETVTVSRSVAGHAVIAGSEVSIESGSTISDWAWIAGARVDVAGNVGNELKVAAGEFILTGNVDGDAYVIGESIRIEDGAVINGDLTWRGDNEPVISDGAVIRGNVIQGPPIETEADEPGIGFRIFLALTLTIAAGALYTVLRAGCEACVLRVQTTPALSLLLGLVVVATTPLVIIILFISGIGALLGVLLSLAYALALLLGLLTGVVSVARLGIKWVRRDEEPRLSYVWGAIAVVALLIAIAGPLGFLINSLLMFCGLGALSLEAWDRARA